MGNSASKAKKRGKIKNKPEQKTQENKNEEKEAKISSDDMKKEDNIGNSYASNWMGQVTDRDHVLLSDINIPGTHDTCCVIGQLGIAKNANIDPAAEFVCTQALSVRQQLESGIRFLDIRCRGEKDKFQIYHGAFDLDISFDEVLSDCGEFLRKNGTECILMSIDNEGKIENCTKTFEEILSDYANAPYPWWTGNTNNIPTLKEVAGTIIPFCRCPNDNFGIDINPWEDNKTFTIGETNKGGIFTIQDQYEKANIIDKKGFIEALLLGNQVPHQYYINFSSMSDVDTLGDPYHAAKQIIPFLWDKLSTLNSGTKVGIIVMDYPELQDGLIGKIASLNKGVTAFKNVYHPTHPEFVIPYVPVLEKAAHAVWDIIQALADINDKEKRKKFTTNIMAHLEKVNPHYCYVIARDYIDKDPKTIKTVESEFSNCDYELSAELGFGTMGFHIISFDKRKHCKFDFKAAGHDAGDINWNHSSDWTVISDGYGVVYDPK